MSDIFREVDEEFKRDQFAQFLKKHGSLIIGVLLLVVLGVGGWRGYGYYQERRAAEAGGRYDEAIRLASDGKAAEAKAMFEGVLKDAPTGYQQLTKFRLASELARSDAAGAIKAFEALAADAGLDPVLRDLARVRAAVLLIDTAPLAEIEQRLQPFAAPGQAWRLTAREGLGLAAFKAGDAEKASKYLEQILADPEATQTVRQRAEILISMARAGSAPTK
ncbi:MAG TPA: tetratricopeptide repeat protein [Beijerinckiaceae bacterium]|nr:tetratricopeptide repeat protein [Beijerinckiaceae bacterium]